LITQIKLLFLHGKLQLIIKIVVVLAAFTYIFYRFFINFEIYKNLSFLLSWNNQKTLFLLFCFLLMYINWLTESVKWKLLLSNIEKISILTALKSVFIGITCAIFTPYRIGEFAGRPILIHKENKLSAILATFVGSVSQSITTIGMGLLGLFISQYMDIPIDLYSLNKFTISISITILSYAGIIYLYFNPLLIAIMIQKSGLFLRWKIKIDFLCQYNFKILSTVLIFSHLRYIIFFLQYFILLHIFNVQIGLLNSFSAISLSYLFLFTIPGIPIAEIGIRGSLALYFLGTYSTNEIAILAASTSLWIINLVIPAILGSVFLLISKNDEENRV